MLVLCCASLFFTPLPARAGPAPKALSEDVFCAEAGVEDQANLNELMSKGGGVAPQLEFVELKVLEDNVDIGGWTLCFTSNPTREMCTGVGVGNGEWYDNDDTVAPDGLDNNGPTGGTIFNTPTWIVYDATNIKADEGEVILFNGSGEVMDYIRYSNKSGVCSDDNRRWEVLSNQTDGNSCGTCFDQKDPSQKDFARSGPDGTGSWENQGDAPTEGDTNDVPQSNGFDVSHDGSASTCVREPIAITALKPSGDVFLNYSGSITVTTSTNNGSWFVTDTGGTSSDPAQGTLTDPTADDGAATYAFDQADDGTVTLYLANMHADDLVISLTEDNGNGSASSGTLSFRHNAFVVSAATCTGSSCPGTGSNEVVTGRGHTFNIDMVRRDPSTGDCGLATAYTGDHALKAWITRDGDDPGGTGPAIDGSATLGDTQAGAAAITVTFSSGTASFALQTTDAGKYTVTMLDDTRTFASAVDITGAVGPLTVRPFGLAFTNINDLAGTPNPGTDTPTGPVFTSAGTDFGITVAAYLWDGADDSDNDGLADAGVNLTDNGTVPSFAWDTDIAAVAPFEPASGVPGNLNGGFVNLVDFASGTATLSVNYTEVGSMTLEATASDYLNTAGVDVAGASVNDGSTGVVGRFTPFDFAVTLDNSPEFTPACSNDTLPFTYMDQPFDYATAPAVTIVARNALGSTTVNYDGAWWRLGDFTESYSHDGVALSGGVSLDDAVAMHTAIDCSAGNCDGTFTTTFSGPFTYARASTPIAPVAALVDIGFSITDADGISYASNPFIINNIDFTNGDSEQRWGRLVVAEEAGSELLALDVPLTAEYFDGSAYVLNTDDDCTAFDLASEVDLRSLATDTVDGDQPVAIGTGQTSTSGNPDLTDGLYQFTFSAPGAGNTGFVEIEIDLTTANQGWLLHDWDEDGAFDNHPVGRGTFGILSRPRQWIYLREPWN